ncbi:unnamed protein product, partial [Musa acuminata subsp. burmannicoides]
NQIKQVATYENLSCTSTSINKDLTQIRTIFLFFSFLQNTTKNIKGHRYLVMYLTTLAFNRTAPHFPSLHQPTEKAMASAIWVLSSCILPSSYYILSRGSSSSYGCAYPSRQRVLPCRPSLSLPGFSTHNQRKGC